VDLALCLMVHVVEACVRLKKRTSIFSVLPTYAIEALQDLTTTGTPWPINHFSTLGSDIHGFFARIRTCAKGLGCDQRP
jgi:hypothetical protein